MLAAHGHGLVHGVARDHEADTGNDAAGVAFYDASVHAGGRAKVVRIDNEVLLHFLSPHFLSPRCRTDIYHRRARQSAITHPRRRLRLCETNVREQARGHRPGLEVFLRYRTCRFAVPSIVAVDSVYSIQRLLHRGEGEKSLTRGQNVAEACILSDHGPPACEIAGISFAEPPAPEANVLILGNRELGA